MGKHTDYSDQVSKTYGNLTITAIERGFCKPTAICLCGCGRVTRKLAADVVHGRAVYCTKSCAASYRDRSRSKVSLVKAGDVFGDLTILWTGSEDGARIATCECACGNIVTKRVHAMTSDGTKCCGRDCGSRRSTPSVEQVKAERAPKQTHDDVCTCKPCRCMRQLDKIERLRKLLRSAA